MGSKINKGMEVQRVVDNIIDALQQSLGTSAGRANLANLRNSIGRPMSQSVQIWPLVYGFMPEYFLGDGMRITFQERAVFTSLGLYAIHQQGKAQTVASREEKRRTVGESLRQLRIEEDSKAVDRRFNALITAQTYDELVHYLRQMISLLKSTADTTIDYGRLAQDLYWFQRGYEEKLRLSWARDYYRIEKNKEEKGAEENE